MQFLQPWPLHQQASAECGKAAGARWNAAMRAVAVEGAHGLVRCAASMLERMMALCLSEAKMGAKAHAFFRAPSDTSAMAAVQMAPPELVRCADSEGCNSATPNLHAARRMLSSCSKQCWLCVVEHLLQQLPLHQQQSRHTHCPDGSGGGGGGMMGGFGGL